MAHPQRRARQRCRRNCERDVREVFGGSHKPPLRNHFQWERSIIETLPQDRLPIDCLTSPPSHIKMNLRPLYNPRQQNIAQHNTENNQYPESSQQYDQQIIATSNLNRSNAATIAKAWEHGTLSGASDGSLKASGATIGYVLHDSATDIMITGQSKVTCHPRLKSSARPEAIGALTISVILQHINNSFPLPQAIAVPL